MIFDRFANLKYKYGNRHFWCRGYFVDTVGRNKNAIAKYIQNQIYKDQLTEQMSLKQYFDPFTGEPVKGSNKKPHDECGRCNSLATGRISERV